MRKFVVICALILCGRLLAARVQLNLEQREAVVVLPAEANFGLQYAAKELTYHIGKMSGVQLQILSEPVAIPEGAFVFSLGETEYAKKHGISGIGMKHNHARFHGDADRMILTGNDRGTNQAEMLIKTNATLFAIYDILENDNGCHWLWPGELGESIPKTPVFQFEAGERTMSTKLRFFFWRQFWGMSANWPSQKDYSDYMNAETVWLLRHRSNRDLAEQHYPHAFETWPDKYLATHPEFFNLLPDGTRRPSPLNWGGQAKLISMCTGSPAFRHQVVQDWLDNYNPNIPRINLKSNDSALQCTCDYCMADDHSQIPTEIRRQRAKERYEKMDRKWFDELGSMTRRQIEFYKGVMAEADRMAPEKQARFSGLIYSNSSDAPEDVYLGPRFQFCYCPPMMFPWTDAKVEKYKKNWEGWYKTGIDMVMRPNFTLDGHCYPIDYSRYFHDCYIYAEPLALKGSDFDSLTGMFGAQGLTLYTIARLQNSRPGLPYETIQSEYLAVFGAAAPVIKEYFEQLEKISRLSDENTFSNRPEGGNWTDYYQAGHVLFTRERLQALAAILDRAEQAVAADSPEAKRVQFLKIGLENARLTAETAIAYDEFKVTGDYMQFAEKVKALDDFREKNAGSFAFNIAFCRWREDCAWPRELAKRMTNNTIALPIDWPFRTDPEKTGEADGWATVDFDESSWEKIPTDRPWDRSGYETFDGYGWYRLRVQLPDNMPGEAVLMVGSADEACDVWINGELRLHRPYPYQGNVNSWNEAFEVPFGNTAHPGENVIAIRVEDNKGQGGLTKRCFLKFVPKDDDNGNAIRNSRFKDGLEGWELFQRNGVSSAAVQQFDGRNAVCFQIEKTDPEKLAFNKYKNYALLHQHIQKLENGKKYQVAVEFRTTPDFDGEMMVFCHADTQRNRLSQSNVQIGFKGAMLQWGTLAKEFLAAMDSGDIYLNYVCNTGKLYFARVSVKELADE